MANVFAARAAWTLGLLKWITVPSSFIIFTWRKRPYTWMPIFIFCAIFSIKNVALFQSVCCDELGNLLMGQVASYEIKSNLKREVKCLLFDSAISLKGSDVKRPTSSIPGILLTCNFFKELCSFLSSVVAVLCTTFFFRRAVPWKHKYSTHCT